MVEPGRQRAGGFTKDRVACGAQTGAVVGAQFGAPVQVRSFGFHEITAVLPLDQIPFRFVRGADGGEAGGELISPFQSRHQAADFAEELHGSVTPIFEFRRGCAFA